ncbi:hypothetical protein [Mycobacterium sp. AZCC_0083]|uniref:hypothetical protein n=1 Tax=Mycobacterium sp. AZCC_0083 TaxID=2735882 RepID=UPI00160C2E6E|nr:hypothetical protein [Mycobacterium sp. AZCC_0083]MBB5167082.1 hypothetical protein [Mycobacterium sp. AZCC_0083]
MAELKGAGLFDLRSLATPTLRQLHDSARVGGAAETAFFATVRRILLERGALS